MSKNARKILSSYSWAIYAILGVEGIKNACHTKILSKRWGCRSKHEGKVQETPEVPLKLRKRAIHARSFSFGVFKLRWFLHGFCSLDYDFDETVKSSAEHEGNELTIVFWGDHLTNCWARQHTSSIFRQESRQSIFLIISLSIIIQ
jgi:hypothetical protein